MSKTVLILGASGRFGRHADKAFRAAGWSVRRFDRNTDSLRNSARGVALIVNAWNPAYPDWAKHVPLLHGQVQQAARESGATVLIPGNVYVFGQNTPAPWSETSNHNAHNPLGRVRIEMERSYRQAGVRTIILRAGDFIDTEPSGNWFDKVMISKLHKGVFTYPGNPDIPHAWAFLPDLARAAVALAEKSTELPDFADIPFGGYTLSGRAVGAALPVSARLSKMAWWPLHLARPVWPLAGHLLEMRYLWDTPHSLDNTEFRTRFPDFAHTPVQEALRQAVSLPAVARTAPRQAHGTT